MRRRSLILLAAIGLSAPAALAAPAVPDSRSEQMEETLQQLFMQGFAELLRTGPVEANWSEGGVDLEAELAARPGGTAGNYLLSTDKNGDPGLDIWTNEPIARFVPTEWQLVDTRGDIDRKLPGNAINLSIADGFAMVVRGNSRKVGTATCMGEIAGAQLYRVPGEPSADDLPEPIMIMIFRATIDYIAKQPICARYDRKGDGFVMRSFMDDGRSLPRMDEMEGGSRIVAAAPVSELLAGD